MVRARRDLTALGRATVLEALLALGLVLRLGEGAWAQPAPEEQAPRAEQEVPPAEPITPPRALRVPEVLLPEGQALSGPVEVLLSIDADGHVTQAELERSHGTELDALLLDAARTIRFEPAMKGSRPVPSRIRFRFEVEPAAESTLEPGASSPTEADATHPENAAVPAEGGPSDEGMRDQVTLEEESPGDAFGATARVDRPQPGAASRVKLRGRELTMIPGTFGEPLRVVATLPGVLRSPFGLGFFLVRGASFQNTGFFVDGFQVPLLYHLGAGPAILSARLVDQLDFYPGGFPVSFGHYTAGVISLRTAPPPTDRFRVEFELDLLRASALAIVPIGKPDNLGPAHCCVRQQHK